MFLKETTQNSIEQAHNHNNMRNFNSTLIVEEIYHMIEI